MPSILTPTPNNPEARLREQLALLKKQLEDLARQPRAPREVSGRVNAGGSVAQGTGFASSNTGTGTYTITPTIPFKTAPIVVAMIDGTNDLLSIKLQDGTSASTTSFSFTTWITNTGNNANSGFYFRASEPV